MRAVLILLVLISIRLCAQPSEPRLLWRHEQLSSVSVHAVSHSGKILALVSGNEVVFWDITTQAFTRRIEIPHDDYLSMAFTPKDDDLILLSRAGWEPGLMWCGNGERPSAPIGKVVRLNLGTGEAKDIEASHHDSGDWSISKNAERIARLDKDGLLTLFDARTYHELRHIRLDSSTKRYMQNSVSFADNTLVVLFQGVIRTFDAVSLKLKHMLDEEYIAAECFGNSLFLLGSYKNRHKNELYDLDEAELNNLETNEPESSRINAVRRTLREGIALGNYIANRYNYFAPRDNDIPRIRRSDSLIVRSKKGKEELWSFKISPFFKILDVLPDHESLLIGNGRDVRIVNVRTHTVRTVSYGSSHVIGFSDKETVLAGSSESTLSAFDERTGKEMWSFDGVPSVGLFLSPQGDRVAQSVESRYLRLFATDGSMQVNDVSLLGSEKLKAFFGDALLTQSYHDSERLYTGQYFATIETPKFTRPFITFLPFDSDTVIAYGNGWRATDSVARYLYKQDRILQSYWAGLNVGVSSVTISPDRKWLATLSGDGVYVFRIADGQVVKSFGIEGRYAPWQITFSPNGRYLIYSNDTAILTRDLVTDKTERAMRIGPPPTVIRLGGPPRRMGFELNRDGSRFALYNWEQGISMYETPTRWVKTDTTFDPQGCVLPLRFYISASAREALDNGKPYSPPRTDVVLELRRSNGTVIKRLVNGALHKGKWHVWNYDMTGEPKGTYILHTEIGGVVRDEKMEVR